MGHSELWASSLPRVDDLRPLFPRGFKSLTFPSVLLSILKYLPFKDRNVMTRGVCKALQPYHWTVPLWKSIDTEVMNVDFLRLKLLPKIGHDTITSARIVYRAVSHLCTPRPWASRRVGDH